MPGPCDAAPSSSPASTAGSAMPMRLRLRAPWKKFESCGSELASEVDAPVHDLVVAGEHIG